MTLLVDATAYEPWLQVLDSAVVGDPVVVSFLVGLPVGVILIGTLVDGAAVRTAEGLSVGILVGTLVDGAAVGTAEGLSDGILIGTLVDGAAVGTAEGLSVGILVGFLVGALLDVDGFADVGFDEGFADVGFDEGFGDVDFDVDGFPVDGDIVEGFADVGFDDGFGDLGFDVDGVPPCMPRWNLPLFRRRLASESVDAASVAMLNWRLRNAWG